MLCRRRQKDEKSEGADFGGVGAGGARTLNRPDPSPSASRFPSPPPTASLLPSSSSYFSPSPPPLARSDTRVRSLVRPLYRSCSLLDVGACTDWPDGRSRKDTTRPLFLPPPSSLALPQADHQPHLGHACQSPSPILHCATRCLVPGSLPTPLTLELDRPASTRPHSLWSVPSLSFRGWPNELCPLA